MEEVYFLAGLSGGGTRLRTHADARPNVRLGAIDHASGDKISTLRRAMSDSGIHTGKLCGLVNLSFKTCLVTL